VWRGGPCPPAVVKRFQEGKARGLERIDDIVRQASLPAGMDAASARHYLSRVIQYDFASAQVEGCLEFFAPAWQAGLVHRPPLPLSFLSEERCADRMAPPDFTVP